MITDMTRSLEMVETRRLIYWTTIFGHRNGSGIIGYIPEYRGVTGTPRGVYWALLGHTGKKEKGLKGGRTPPLGSFIYGGKGAP